MAFTRYRRPGLPYLTSHRLPVDHRDVRGTIQVGTPVRDRIRWRVEYRHGFSALDRDWLATGSVLGIGARGINSTRA